jgi:hypothetical protein
MTINYTKWSLNIINGRKLCTTNCHKIYQHYLFKVPPKYTQIGIFWHKSKPSGNHVLLNFYDSFFAINFES